MYEIYAVVRSFVGSNSTYFYIHDFNEVQEINFNHDVMRSDNEGHKEWSEEDRKKRHMIYLIFARYLISCMIYSRHSSFPAVSLAKLWTEHQEITMAC